MLYRVGGRILDGRNAERRFVCVEAESGGAAAEAARVALKDEAGRFAVIVDEVRPAEIAPEKKAPVKKAGKKRRAG